MINILELAETNRPLAIYYQNLTALKIPHDQALKAGEVLCELVNAQCLSEEEAIRLHQNLNSALIGNTRAVYKYGISLDNNTLKNKAIDMGIAPVGSSELTKQQKILSTFKLILEHTDWKNA